MDNCLEWLAQVVEEIEEPERPIVDTHFHLWKDSDFGRYLLDDLWADTGNGHRIEQMVFLECRSEYFNEGPDHLRPLGETKFVAEAAAQATSAPRGVTQIGGIIGMADLMLGDAVEDVLQAQKDVSDLFRGIRYSASWDASDEVSNAATDPPPHLYEHATFRQGFARLAPLGMSFDAWNYHPQIVELVELARAFPDTTIVANHLGGILGIGPYRGCREEIYAQWKQRIAQLSECPNVVVKLGGVAQPYCGYEWEKRELPLNSDEYADVYKHYYLYAIEQFGPKRCMFESNFPVDRISISYKVLWNGFKKMVASFSEDEKEAMFRGTAMRVYRLDAIS